jgi:hypothetical protein
MNNDEIYIVMSNKYWDNDKIKKIRKNEQKNFEVLFDNSEKKNTISMIMKLKGPFEFSDEKNYYQSLLMNTKKF